MRIGTIDTPFGESFVAWTSRGVVALEAFVTGGRPDAASWSRFVESVGEMAGDAPEPDRMPASMMARAKRAFDGDTRRAPVDLSVFAPLQHDVYRSVMSIPRGSVASYADIAGDIGRPRAWRAVGNALRRCPIDLLVPCHRVVHAGGTIAAGTRSIEWKRILLRREGVTL